MWCVLCALCVGACRPVSFFALSGTHNKEWLLANSDVNHQSRPISCSKKSIKESKVSYKHPEFAAHWRMLDSKQEAKRHQNRGFCFSSSSICLAQSLPHSAVNIAWPLAREDRRWKWARRYFDAQSLFLFFGREPCIVTTWTTDSRRNLSAFHFAIGWARYLCPYRTWLRGRQAKRPLLGHVAIVAMQPQAICVCVCANGAKDEHPSMWVVTVGINYTCVSLAWYTWVWST